MSRMNLLEQQDAAAQQRVAAALAHVEGMDTPAALTTWAERMTLIYETANCQLIIRNPTQEERSVGQHDPVTIDVPWLVGLLIGYYGASPDAIYPGDHPKAGRRVWPETWDDEARGRAAQWLLRGRFPQVIRPIAAGGDA